MSPKYRAATRSAEGDLVESIVRNQALEQQRHCTTVDPYTPTCPHSFFRDLLIVSQSDARKKKAVESPVLRGRDQGALDFSDHDLDAAKERLRRRTGSRTGALTNATSPSAPPTRGYARRCPAICRRFGGRRPARPARSRKRSGLFRSRRGSRRRRSAPRWTRGLRRSRSCWSAPGYGPEELFALERRDLDLEAGVLSIERVHSQGVLKDCRKSSRQRRRVPLRQRVVQALKSQPPRLDTPLVFPAARGGYIDGEKFR